VNNAAREAHNLVAARSKGLNPRAAAAVERVGRSPLHHPSPLHIGQTEG
jgi:hypothetical protein